jgi:hypothetical protein
MENSTKNSKGQSHPSGINFKIILKKQGLTRPYVEYMKMQLLKRYKRSKIKKSKNSIVLNTGVTATSPGIRR